MLDKLQKQIWRAACPSLAASLEPLAHHQNVTRLSLFYRYYFGKCSSELAQRVLLPFSQGGILIILMHCMIFLSPVPDVARIYMLTVSFLTQLNLHTITI